MNYIRILGSYLHGTTYDQWDAAGEEEYLSNSSLLINTDHIVSCIQRMAKEGDGLPPTIPWVEIKLDNGDSVVTGDDMTLSELARWFKLYDHVDADTDDQPLDRGY